MQDLLDRLRSALAGRYRIDREVGRGGMAIVFLAHDERHARDVAVKVLRPDLAWSIGVDRFLREIRIAAGLTHPHILPLFDSGEVAPPVPARAGADGPDTGPLLYYVMPYVAGESLRRRLDREQQLPVQEAVAIARQAAAALAHAHAQGVVHRDIKPENILLEDGEAVIADFGIARAIEAAAADQLSEPGLVVGTPAYMSPEQASGGDVDARSDVYSLGCVVYEMLAGEPPFTGATPHAVIARQQTEAPRPLRHVRPGVSEELEAVVLAALAKVRAERYRTAAEFGDALGMVTADLTTTGRLPRRRRRRWPWLVAFGAAVVAALLVSGSGSAAPKYDESLVLVAPFAHRGGVAPGLLDGELCELLLHRAAAHWDGLRLVDPLWVSDARARHDLREVRLEDALALATERRAGRLLTGQLYQVGDTLYVYGVLYDVPDRAPLRVATISVAPDLRDAGARFAVLARTLLAGTPARADDTTAGMGTRSLPAWRAFDRGMLAFRRWSFDTAAAEFAAAVREDPDYPQPRLWLAQLQLLTGAGDEVWRQGARQAADLASVLPPLDRARARALHALGEGRFIDACEEYAGMVQRDSLDFLAWFGLGECRQRDRLVVRDSATASGWRFRSSPQAAVDAYRHALEVLPSSHTLFRGRAFTRLGGLFVTEHTHYRLGYRIAGGDTVRYGAWPGLAGDTLRMIPYPVAALLADAPGVRPASHARAVTHGRVLLREVAATWVRALPGSADAHEAAARAHELLGELEQGDAGALAETRRARSLAADPQQRLRLAVAEVRLQVKREQFAVARRLADSLLAQPPGDDPEAARLLAAVAALTGRVYRSAELSRRAAPAAGPAFAWDGTPVDPPAPLASSAAAFLTYASLGAPADSIRRLRADAVALVGSYFPRPDEARAREALLGRAEDFAFFETGMPPPAAGPPHGYVSQMAGELAAGDTAAVRARLGALLRERSGYAGEVTVDGILLEARLLAALGDSAAAAAHLDRMLHALPALGTELLDEVRLAASLVRAMALRAELGARGGDRAAARRWAAAVAELWSGADPPLAPTVSLMEALR